MTANAVRDEATGFVYLRFQLDVTEARLSTLLAQVAGQYGKCFNIGCNVVLKPKDEFIYSEKNLIKLITNEFNFLLSQAEEAGAGE